MNVDLESPFLQSYTMSDWNLPPDHRFDSQEFDFNDSLFPQDTDLDSLFADNTRPPNSTTVPTSYYYQQSMISSQQLLLQHHHQSFHYPTSSSNHLQQQEPGQQQQQWPASTSSSSSDYFQLPGMASFPSYSDESSYPKSIGSSGVQRSRASSGYLSPDISGLPRPTRSTSYASARSCHSNYSRSDVSRSSSPNASEMSKWGCRNSNGTWSCAYPGCSSRSVFSRGCDLRKHFKRHTKSLFCRYDGCAQATEGGFSSKKDRARHEAKHNPTVLCEWEGCVRLFSRVDNMKDHVRRVHKPKPSH